MLSLWRLEGIRICAVVACGLLIGVLGGNAWLGLSVTLLLLLLWHLRRALQLLHWLQRPKSAELPEAGGIWEQLNNQSLEIHRRYRKRKKRLATLLQEFRASTAALPDAAVVIDAQGGISWFNEAAVRLLGLKGPADIGQRVINLLRHPDFKRYFEGEDRDFKGVAIPWPHHPASTLWMRIVPYGHEQKLLIARDISAFKRLEQARRDFVANASHELRTPLTVVRGYLDMLAEDSASDGPLQRWQAPVNEMCQQSLRMQQIIDDLLKLANLESGESEQAEEIDMPALLSACLDEAAFVAEQRMDHNVDSALHMTGRRSQIHSVVTNLLSNAIRYTPAGGEIRLDWFLQDHAAVLEIRDNGIGISDEDLPRLTERFYRADVARSRASGGTGLGLAIVKHALERHDGELEIESRPGRGSCFRCRFPASRVVWRRANPTSGGS